MMSCGNDGVTKAKVSWFGSWLRGDELCSTVSHLNEMRSPFLNL